MPAFWITVILAMVVFVLLCSALYDPVVKFFKKIRDKTEEKKRSQIMKEIIDITKE